MFGRFFAFEMGCPDEDTYQPVDQVMSLEEIQAQMTQEQEQSQDTATLICECKGLGCNKCKRKKAKVITLTGRVAPMPVMNMSPMRMPLSPWSVDMIMLNKRTF